MASWWAARKHIANWWLWIAVDLVYIGEYIYKNLRLTAALYALLVALAVLGLRDWQSRAHTSAQQSSVCEGTTCTAECPVQTAACTTLRSGSPFI